MCIFKSARCKIIVCRKRHLFQLICKGFPNTYIHTYCTYIHTFITIFPPISALCCCGSALNSSGWLDITIVCCDWIRRISSYISGNICGVVEQWRHKISVCSWDHQTHKGRLTTCFTVKGCLWSCIHATQRPRRRVDAVVSVYGSACFSERTNHSPCGCVASTEGYNFWEAQGGSARM